jgi:hypothetical protein
MSKIAFDYEPFRAVVSSHGYYFISAKDVPSAVDSPLPGVLEQGRAEALNETWDSEGREPNQLIGNDDDMPDLEDPRLERCVRAFIEKHWLSLQRRHEETKKRWEKMQGQLFVVDGVPLRTGQRIRLFGPTDDGKEFVFYAFGDKPKTVYLFGENGLRVVWLGPLNRLEPLD